MVGAEVGFRAELKCKRAKGIELRPARVPVLLGNGAPCAVCLKGLGRPHREDCVYLKLAKPLGQRTAGLQVDGPTACKDSLAPRSLACVTLVVL